MDIDYDHESRQFRGHQGHVQRTAKARLNIDPGFVHYRKIESFIGRHINLVNAMVEKIPSASRTTSHNCRSTTSTRACSSISALSTGSRL
jgi:hypothetical protein